MPEPFALLEVEAQGLRVAATNAAARKFSVTPGLAFTDAKARCPQLVVEDIDRQADAKALLQLGYWMIRFTPMVALDERDGLILETTGCDHLYHGEAGMVSRIGEILTREAIPFRSGLADTPLAASAIARSTKPGLIVPSGEIKNSLAPLSISTLRVSHAAETLLRRFGLNQIGQLYTIDRKALARRFQSTSGADAVLQKLDRALGHRQDPITPLRAEPAKCVELKCPEPIATGEAISLGLKQLADALCAQLSSNGLGARQFMLVAYRCDGSRAEVEIATARPVRSSEHIIRLFEARIDRMDPGFGIDLLTLEAHRTDVMAANAVALSGDLAAENTDLIAVSALCDRITAKLGDGSVRQIDVSCNHQPEDVETYTPFSGEFSEAETHNVVAGPRPLRLLRHPERVEVLAEVPDGPPQRFIWRRLARRVIKADGPERIAPNWWAYTAPTPEAAPHSAAERKWLSPKWDPRADALAIAKARTDLEQWHETLPVKALPRARDYYRVEDAHGRRYWLFRKGLYDDGRGSPPDWYIHGLFA